MGVQWMCRASKCSLHVSTRYQILGETSRHVSLGFPLQDTNMCIDTDIRRLAHIEPTRGCFKIRDPHNLLELCLTLQE